MSCECETLIVGEAGPRGSQGLSGLPGTNGTNGINSYTQTTASFVQPNAFPATPNTVTVSVLESSWMAVGQSIYISQAGYYKVTAIPSSLLVTLQLLNVEASSGSTINSGAKVSPAGVASYVDPSTTSLTVNPTYAASTPSFRVFGSNTSKLIEIDSSLNKVGLNFEPLSGSSFLTVNGSTSIVGDLVVTSGVTKSPSIKLGTSQIGSLTKVFVSEQSPTVTLTGTIGAVTKTTLTVSGVSFGDLVFIGYSSNPPSSFESDVSITASVSAVDTITVFFQNYSSTGYASQVIPLRILVLGTSTS